MIPAAETAIDSSLDASQIETSTAKLLQQPSNAAPLALILLAIFGIALFLRTQHLDAISFWFDEACSWKISQFSTTEMLDAVSRDAHPPVYYFVLKIWMSVFGTSVIAARSLSVLCGVGTVAAAWWFCRTALSTDSTCSTSNPPALSNKTSFAFALLPLLAALLVAINALQIEMSLEARPYTLGTLLALLSGTFLLLALERPVHVWNWLAFALSAGLLSLTHYYAIFTTAALFLFLAIELVLMFCREGWTGKLKAACLGGGLSLWGIQLLWVPWFSIFTFQRERADGQLWMVPITWNEVMTTCWKAIAGGKMSPVWNDVAWMAVLAWIAVGVLLLMGNRACRLAGICTLLPLAAAVTYGLVDRNILGVRYLIFAEVFLLVGVVLLLSRVQGYFRLTLAVLICGWCLIWTVNFVHDRDLMAEAPGTRGAIQYLNDHRVGETPVIVSSPFVHTIALQYIKVPQQLYAQYRGDHRSSILSGPALQDQDYAGLDDLLKSKPDTIWTVDADGLFGGMSAVRLPESYQLVSEERFPERFGYRMDLLVREYRTSAVARVTTVGLTSEVD
ncbi:glycosyltransferase family 39 protein [Planctomicrobium piriforme]|uniref:Glycosyltransferase RgtA/B/C/D-like domain-containing protein n=1 Tax=Planctomicrobium piriforme TaxID=1576369 RepID=A0A1I3JY16_9PLAN|nr:glycosyltransferase family 39 protein [Planctomicrobium piriforme]SFI65157.1 hypothetical protein SAMN05421753_11154 [Planctomicrobium piriforme]